MGLTKQLELRLLDWQLEQQSQLVCIFLEQKQFEQQVLCPQQLFQLLLFQH
jgi:hypothetical protein